jgi:hypothetical protein
MGKMETNGEGSGRDQLGQLVELGKNMVWETEKSISWLNRIYRLGKLETDLET